MNVFACDGLVKQTKMPKVETKRCLLMNGNSTHGTIGPFLGYQQFWLDVIEAGIDFYRSQWESNLDGPVVCPLPLPLNSVAAKYKQLWFIVMLLVYYSLRPNFSLK